MELTDKSSFKGGFFCSKINGRGVRIFISTGLDPLHLSLIFEFEENDDSKFGF